MNWETWGLFALTETILCLTPGPAVLLVLSQGLTRGRLAALWSSLGVLAGNGFYFVLSATSLGAILLASDRLFMIVKWIGAAYLVWLGVTTFFGKSSVFTVRVAERDSLPWHRMLMNGLLLQGANPKALIFFTAILPQFIDARRAVAFQVALLGVTSIVIEFIVLACYGSFAGQLTELATRPRFAKLTERVAGTMLVTAGAGLAAVRRAS